MMTKLGVAGGVLASWLLCAGCGGTEGGGDAVGAEELSEQRSGDLAHGDVADVVADGVGDGSGDIQGEVRAEDLMPSYPLDDVLKLNQIQVKGTHNSYHLIPDELAAAQWNYAHAPLTEQLEEQNVREVELDVHWDPEAGGFRVFHIPVLDDKSTCDKFVDCLALVKEWSDAHPGHVPLFILVEPKDDVDPPSQSIVGHYRDLDAEILSVWPRERLVMPEDVKGEYASLQEAAKAGAWPTLGFCRNKAVFIMLDHTEHGLNYIAEDPEFVGRPFFIMAGSEETWTAFWEVGNPLNGKETIAANVGLGYMLRTTADTTNPDGVADNAAKAEAARVSGAHVISTDYPAVAAEGEYWFQLGEDVPARCNPLTAPVGCTTEDVENLKHLEK